MALKSTVLVLQSGSKTAHALHIAISAYVNGAVFWGRYRVLLYKLHVFARTVEALGAHSALCLPNWAFSRSFPGFISVLRRISQTVPHESRQCAARVARRNTGMAREPETFWRTWRWSCVASAQRHERV